MQYSKFNDWRDWCNFRKKRFWAIVLIVTYTFAGFFLAPLLIQHQLPGIIDNLINRDARVAKVELNLWTMQLRVYDLELDDDKGQTLARFDQIHLNLQLRSLFRFALVLGDVELLGPQNKIGQAGSRPRLCF